MMAIDSDEKYHKLAALLPKASDAVRPKLEAALHRYRSTNPHVGATFTQEGIPQEKMGEEAPPAFVSLQAPPKPIIAMDSAPVPGEPEWMTRERQKVASAEAEAQGAEASRDESLRTLTKLVDPRYSRPQEYTGKDHPSYSWRNMLPDILPGGRVMTYYDPSNERLLEEMAPDQRARIAALPSHEQLYELDKIRDERWVQVYDQATQTGEPVRRYNQRLSEGWKGTLDELQREASAAVAGFGRGLIVPDAIARGVDPEGAAEADDHFRESAIGGAVGYLGSMFVPASVAGAVGSGIAKAAKPVTDLAARGGRALGLGARTATAGGAGAAGAAAQSIAEDTVRGGIKRAQGVESPEELEGIGERAEQNALFGLGFGVGGHLLGEGIGAAVRARRDPMRSKDAQLLQSADALGIESRLTGGVRAPEPVAQLRNEAASSGRGALDILRDRYTTPTMRGALQQAQQMGVTPEQAIMLSNEPRFLQGLLRHSQETLQDPAITNVAKYHQTKQGKTPQPVSNLSAAISDRIRRGMDKSGDLPAHTEMNALRRLWNETHEVVMLPEGQVPLEPAPAPKRQRKSRPSSKTMEVSEDEIFYGGDGPDIAKTLPPGPDDAAAIEFERQIRREGSFGAPKGSPHPLDIVPPGMQQPKDFARLSQDDINVFGAEQPPQGMVAWARPRRITAQQLDDTLAHLRKSIKRDGQGASDPVDQALVKELEAAAMSDRDKFPAHPKFAPAKQKFEIVGPDGKPKTISKYSAAHRRSSEVRDRLESEMHSVGLPAKLTPRARKPGEPGQPEPRLSPNDHAAFRNALKKGDAPILRKLLDEAGVRTEFEQLLKEARLANPKATTEELVIEIAELSNRGREAKGLIEGNRVSQDLLNRAAGGDVYAVGGAGVGGSGLRGWFGGLGIRTDPLQRRLASEGTDIVSFVRRLREQPRASRFSSMVELAPLRGGAAGFRHGAGAAELNEEDKKDIAAIIRALDERQKKK